MRRGAVLALGGLACLLLVGRPSPPRWMWNATASVPIGLYVLSPPGQPALGDLVVVRPPPAMARLLAQRGWLPPGVPLLKPVAALEGQVVCRVGATVTIDGLARITARRRDRLGRRLPAWNGCRRLTDQEVFVANPRQADSFDGRYFGVLPRTSILARAEPLWRPTSRIDERPAP